MGRNKLTLNEFQTGLNDRYPGIMSDMVKLLQDPTYSLSEIARKYEFSREYASQIFHQLYGIPYSKIQKQLKDGQW